MLPTHLQRGAAGEQQACAWLQQHGLKLLCSNFRCKVGELDLIMRDGDCLVIVEVRYRASTRRGGPLHSVTSAKQQRIIRATRHFLQRHRHLAALPLRFDVLAMSGPLAAPEINWCRRAFDSHKY